MSARSKGPKIAIKKTLRTPTAPPKPFGKAAVNIESEDDEVPSDDDEPLSAKIQRKKAHKTPQPTAKKSYKATASHRRHPPSDDEEELGSEDTEEEEENWSE